MSTKYLVLATLLAVATNATPVVNAAPSPVAAAAPATSSVTPSLLSYTVYFASEQCEFTSTSQSVKENTCADLFQDTGNVSYRLTTFQRGTDFPGDSCRIEYFTNGDCGGTPSQIVPASELSTACEAETSPVSVKFVCS